MNQASKIEVQTINHLGIIAGIIDEIGIVEIINERLGIKPQEKLNSGLIVKSIILNAMGFVSRPLYLFPQFFNDKATEHLFGEGIYPEYFNDDKIGRVMDKLYEFGLNKIFLAITWAACQKYGVNKTYSHLDSTSISLPVEKESNYGGIKQKWIIIESAARKKSDLKQLSKKILKDEEKANSLLTSLSRKNYENRTEIKAVFEWEQKKLKYHHLVLKDVAKTRDKKNKTVYKATIALEKKIRNN